jgi:chromate transporter
VNPVALFGLMLKASLFSTSGLGNLPSLHDDLLARGWATERQFAAAVAIGQITPGPSGLWVISLGYLLGGAYGVLVSVLAIVLPPVLVLALDRLRERAGDHPAVEGFVRGLGLGVVGTFVVVLVRLLSGGAGMDLGSLMIVAGSLLLTGSGRVPVLSILALAALVGMVLY